MQKTVQPKEDRRIPTRLRSIGRAVIAVAIGMLALFHVLLLVERLRDLTILEPWVALQWIGTLFLVAFLGLLVRHGVSLLRGRSALAFWLLVLLLHLIPAVPASFDAEVPTELLVTLPTTWLVSVALWLVVALGASLLPLSAWSVRPSLRPLHRRRGSARLEAGFRSLLFARPPPLARRH